MTSQQMEDIIDRISQAERNILTVEQAGNELYDRLRSYDISQQGQFQVVNATLEERSQDIKQIVEKGERH